jgi:hypothetical protein
MSIAPLRDPLLKLVMSFDLADRRGKNEVFKENQADTKLSDFSRPVRTMVTSCWSVMGLPKM